METKLIIPFGSTARAKAFVEKVKKLPHVSYATDYQRMGGNAAVMVCGEFTPDQAEKIKSKRI
jgi:hypothetical protein